jgi:hypothetical protein
VGDQRLVRVGFEREVVAQEPCQLIFDGLGFGLRSGEPQEVVVGLCRASDYADCVVKALVSGVDPVRWSA